MWRTLNSVPWRSIRDPRPDSIERLLIELPIRVGHLLAFVDAGSGELDHEETAIRLSRNDSFQSGIDRSSVGADAVDEVVVGRG